MAHGYMSKTWRLDYQFGFQSAKGFNIVASIDLRYAVRGDLPDKPRSELSLPTTLCAGF